MDGMIEERMTDKVFVELLDLFGVSNSVREKMALYGLTSCEDVEAANPETLNQILGSGDVATELKTRVLLELAKKEKTIDVAVLLSGRDATANVAGRDIVHNHFYPNGSPPENRSLAAPHEKEKIAALMSEAKSGDAEAQYQIGLLFLQGVLPDLDHGHGIRSLEAAALQSHAGAQFRLGIIFLEGHQGLRKDEERAFRYLHQAAESGDLTAQNTVGMCYANARGVQQDMAMAVKWFQTAADANCADAQLNLGNCLHFGRGVAKDLQRAFKYLQLAANQGLASAQKATAVCYQKGWGTPPDPLSAAYWFKLAKDQGCGDI